MIKNQPKEGGRSHTNQDAQNIMATQQARTKSARDVGLMKNVERRRRSSWGKGI